MPTLHVWNHEISLAVVLLLCAAAAVAAVIDVCSRRVPNLITIPLFFAALTWAAAAEGVGGAGIALASAVICALPYLVLFLLGGGAGDAKLMLALGAWCTPVQAIVLVGCVAICGLIIALAIRVHQNARMVRESAMACVANGGEHSAIPAGDPNRNVLRLGTPAGRFRSYLDGAGMTVTDFALRRVRATQSGAASDGTVMRLSAASGAAMPYAPAILAGVLVWLTGGVLW